MKKQTHIIYIIKQAGTNKQKLVLELLEE